MYKKILTLLFVLFLCTSMIAQDATRISASYTNNNSQSPFNSDGATIVRYDDGTNENSIGLTSGGTFEVSARFRPDQLGALAGQSVTQVEIYINDGVTDVVVKIYGAGTPILPGAVLYSQSHPVTTLSWNLITLTTPVPVDGNDLWVGYEVTHSAGTFPAGLDETPPLDVDGDWIYFSGAWDHLASFGLPGDWNIAAYVESGGGCNGVIFSDDFESGTGQWILGGTWGLATNEYNSPVNSLTESPGGNYAANLNIAATMANGVDLSDALGAELKFWAKYDIEQGFDYMYLEVTDDGTNWVQLEAFNAEGVPWTEFTYDISGFAGSSEVKVRFRFFSDGGYEVDGMYIDDFEISCSDVDLSPPLIVHTGPEFYEATPDPFDVVADITDISGVASAEVQFTVDGGSVQSINPSNISGETYTFTIPAQQAGSWVDYSILATDNVSNTTVDPQAYKYISGTYVAYDDPEVTFYVPFATPQGASVRMTPPVGEDILVTALIRNYTDVNNPNDDMLFHVYSDVGGLPGTDLITPFLVTPEATLQNTSAMTRVDLRPYLAQLSNLTSDFHIGFTVPSGTVNITEGTPIALRSTITADGTSWQAWTSGDFHFRVVMGNPSNIPVELTSFTATVGNIGQVVLNWSTATETNNHIFEIERRAEQGEYFTIGYVNGAGTTTEPQNYSYTDKSVETGKYFYRLKQLDFDGRHYYSNEVEVDVKGPLAFNLEQNYPNPFNPSTNIKFSVPESGNVLLAIYNIVGEEVATLVNGFTEAGFYNVTFDASSLPSGIYLYKLQSANSVQTKKMMLLK